MDRRRPSNRRAVAEFCHTLKKMRRSDRVTPEMMRLFLEGRGRCPGGRCGGAHLLVAQGGSGSGVWIPESRKPPPKTKTSEGSTMWDPELRKNPPKHSKGGEESNMWDPELKKKNKKNNIKFWAIITAAAAALGLSLIQIIRMLFKMKNNREEPNLRIKKKKKKKNRCNKKGKKKKKKRRTSNCRKIRRVRTSRKIRSIRTSNCRKKRRCGCGC